MWELLRRIANWFFKLSADWQDYQKIKREFSDLEKEVHELRQRNDIRKNLTFEKGIYWDKENKHDSGPFCPLCVDTSRGKIHLDGSSGRGWDCMECKNTFSTEESRKKEQNFYEDQRRDKDWI